MKNLISRKSSIIEKRGTGSTREQKIFLPSCLILTVFLFIYRPT